MLNSFIIVI